jgi:hypothetical protein
VRGLARSGAAALCGRGGRCAAECGTRARDSDGDVVERRGSGFWARCAPLVVGPGIAVWIVYCQRFRRGKDTDLQWTTASVPLFQLKAIGLLVPGLKRPQHSVPTGFQPWLLAPLYNELAIQV